MVGMRMGPGDAPPRQTETSLSYATPQGRTFEEMREAFIASPLYAKGDAKLMWVNEGDFWALMTRGIRLEDCTSPKDPDRARTLAEAGHDLEDRDWVAPAGPPRAAEPASKDLTDLKAALEGLREAWPECWALRNNGAPMDPEVRAVADTLLIGERAGLLTEDKPVDALEVAASVMQELIDEVEANINAEFPERERQTHTIQSMRYERDMDLPRRARAALSALQRAKGGGE